jgi:uncharacterized protein YkwD
MKQIAVLLTAVFLAAFATVGMSAVEPRVAAADATIRSCTGSKVTLKTTEKIMLDLHNQKRASRGLPRLCVHPTLQKAARAHSVDMIQRDYFSHYTKGRDEGPCERLRRYGYRWRLCGENIAWGSGSKGSSESRFRAWMKSPSHKANILNRGVPRGRNRRRQRNLRALWQRDDVDRRLRGALARSWLNCR